MSTFIVPIYDDINREVWNEVVTAPTLEVAKQRIMNKIVNQYELDVPADYEDFLNIATDSEIIVGQIQDIETL